MATSGTQLGPLAANFGEESQSDKLARKARESPLMPIGILINKFISKFLLKCY